MAGDFRLSATLKGHEEDVRALSFPTPEMLFSASRDNTVRQWTRTTPKPPTYDDKIALQSSHWLNGLALLSPSKQNPAGLIATGGRETFVFVKHIGAPVEEDPHRLLIGHAGNITCLAFSQDGSKILSGGWDSQVFVWDVEAGNVTAELKGHGGPVWGVMVFDQKIVITACADQMIRIFDIGGKLLKTIKGHTDVVRCFCKLPTGHSSGAAFASAGNDEIIRLWSLDGQPMGELHGHTAYIYSLAALPNGDIVSSSEDRTVRVWRDGRCIQTITHPAISIWAVAVCPESGDIVSGASDNIIRIFSRDPERQADAATLKAFDDTNGMYAIPAETAAQGEQFNTENLPGPEALQSKVGERDGQQLFIKEANGSVTAHLWSASTSQWNLIGTVVSGQGTSASKKMYEGKEYDFLFDIDIDEGKPPLKLPYNLTESPWDAARKFLERNELPFSYYEQVANWISENTKGARLGQAVTSSAQPQQAQDPWGSDRRYKPGDGGYNGARKFPVKSYSKISEGNALNAVNKIAESSQQVQGDGALSSEDLEALKLLVDQLNTNPQDPTPTKAQISALVKASTAWPNKLRVPAIALLARLAVSSSFANTTTGSASTNIVDTLKTSGLLAQNQATANNAVHALRLLVNLFISSEGRSIVDLSSDRTLELVRPFASAPESPAQFRALATLYLNYAVLLASGTSRSTDRDARATALLIDMATMLECESPHAGDADGLVNVLCGLGTLLHVSQEMRDTAKGGLAGTLHFLNSKSAAKEPKVQEVVLEIRDELR
ncbi:PFU-domain-containing protein [Acrodontium crateriforme]|uniref:PFU-domain-containing protein n=1 Tax=Acrodontium crateriforme TaxID=150365 RepID=A0AAQ3MCW5_9PEZI|nr:PFU-domain-containing protein [Acrodontium crateriforme]